MTIDDKNRLEARGVGREETAAGNPAATTETRELLLAHRARTAGTEHELSINQLARKIGYSASVVSQYLDEGGNKYPGDTAKLERAISDFLHNELRRKASGVATVETEQTRALRGGLEYIRKTNDVGMVLAEAGVTKTRAIDFYIGQNPLAILFRARAWCRTAHDVEQALFEAVKGGWDNRTRRVAHVMKKLTGSDRLVIVDDAHKLTRPALQWFFDFHDETFCPVALVGVYELADKLEDDAQRFSRVGLRWEVKPESPEQLIGHLIKSLCPGITTGEARALLPLCEQVAEQHGHFRSVHKQLKVAAEIKEGMPGTAWEQAFKAAHTMLVRKYPLN